MKVYKIGSNVRNVLTLVFIIYTLYNAQLFGFPRNYNDFSLNIEFTSKTRWQNSKFTQNKVPQIYVISRYYVAIAAD